MGLDYPALRTKLDRGEVQAMSELVIDWSKAPEGATQYAVGSIWPWEMVSDGRLYYYNGSGWHGLGMNHADYQRQLIKRPTTPQWSGEGFPVGI